MNRKQRRAEKFNHFSDSRVDYHPRYSWNLYIRADIVDAYNEMRQSILDARVDNYFIGSSDKNAPQFQYRDEFFYLTH